MIEDSQQNLGQTSKIKNLLQKINPDLKLFLDFFIFSSFIVWALYPLVIYAYDGFLIVIIVMVFILPIVGGFIRGMKSRGKEFWIIIVIWFFVLSFGYVPLYAWLTDVGFGLYSNDLVIGLIVAGIMLVSSLIGYGVRKIIERKV